MAKLVASFLHQAKSVDGTPLRLRFNEKELSFAASSTAARPPDKEGLVRDQERGKVGHTHGRTNEQTEHNNMHMQKPYNLARNSLSKITGGSSRSLLAKTFQLHHT